MIESLIFSSTQSPRGLQGRFGQPARLVLCALGAAITLILAGCSELEPREGTGNGRATTAAAEGTEAVQPPSNGALVRFQVPRFGVDSPIEAIGISANNELQVPGDPLNTGWYSIYDKPGAGGNAVLSAHVDYWPDIHGPFYDLFKLHPGDTVRIILDDGTELVYEVFFKERYDAASIPMGDLISAPQRPSEEEWLTMVTCGGRFQTFDGEDEGPGDYLDRDVVVARRIA